MAIRLNEQTQKYEVVADSKKRGPKTKPRAEEKALLPGAHRTKESELLKIWDELERRIWGHSELPRHFADYLANFNIQRLSAMDYTHLARQLEEFVLQSKANHTSTIRVMDLPWTLRSMLVTFVKPYGQPYGIIPDHFRNELVTLRLDSAISTFYPFQQDLAGIGDRIYPRPDPTRHVNQPMVSETSLAAARSSRIKRPHPDDY